MLQKTRVIQRLLGVVILSALLLPAHAATSIRFSSGPLQTLLLELYTSEGCSSCPPAEAYLNSLAHDPQL